MLRKLRIEYAGAIYHVTSRANGKGDVFLNAADRQDFLKTLAEACQKTGFQVPADGAEWEPLRRGWCLGPPQFKAQLLERMEGKLGEHHAGELKRESAAAKAERIIREELRVCGGRSAIWQSGPRATRPSWPWRRECVGKRR